MLFGQKLGTTKKVEEGRKVNEKEDISALITKMSF